MADHDIQNPGIHWVQVDLGSRRLYLKKPFFSSGGTRDTKYTKQQCLYIIKSTTVKGSEERGKLISFMVKWNLVPSKSALYQLLQRDEDGLPIGDNNWGLKEHDQDTQEREPFEKIVSDTISMMPSPPALPPVSTTKMLIKDEAARLGESAKINIRGMVGWKGRLRLPVTPVRFCDHLHRTNLSSPTFVDICQYIGSCDIYDGKKYIRHIERYERIQKLYFNQKWYKPPNDMDYGGESTTFGQLKSNIRSISEEEGSPVICSGGSKKNHYKIFTCNKNKHGHHKKCPFSFQVRWDEFGYYIHLLPSMKHFYRTGCSWHCCNS